MKSLLIVDDSPLVRRILRRIAEKAGFQTGEAGDGWEALAACAARRPDVALVDWRMPVMEGPEFIRELRRCFDGADPVVIVCAAVADLPRARRVLGAEVEGHVTKPSDAQLVRNELHRVGVLRSLPARAAA